MDLLNASVQELEAIRKDLLIARTGEFSPKGFSAYYKLRLGNDLPGYSLDNWIQPIFDAKKLDKGAEIFAWRGSWKTTTVSITFGEFFIGHHPERANLVIGSSDANANKITGAITSTIEYSDTWKKVFPHVVPDKEKKWGENGYEVMRTDMDYDKWVDLNAARGDPTLLGLGIGSKTLIGKHPDGLLLLDDILDEDNTSSVRQMSAVATKVTGTILPFIVEDESNPLGERLITWPVVIGTPWQEDDAYQDIKNTGEFLFSSTPIMVECDEDEGTYIEYEKIKGWYEFTAPERYSTDSIIRFYNRSAHKEFMRMYMLDLSVQMEGEGLEFRSYPHDKIDMDSVMTCGVDYMSMMKEKNIDLRNRSFYAQAYLFKLPDGRAVVGGGWHGRPTQMKAETKMGQAEVFPGHRGTFFESDGKGEEALQVFLRNPNLTIIPMNTQGRGKPERLEKELGPWLERGKILISDKDTPFLNFLRKNLRKYPKWHVDAIDAVYWAARGMPEVMVLDNPKTHLPRSERYKKKITNPYYAVGSN